MPYLGTRPRLGPWSVPAVVSAFVPAPALVKKIGQVQAAASTVSGRVDETLRLFHRAKGSVVSTAQTVEEMSSKVNKTMGGSGGVGRHGEILVLVDGRWVQKGQADGLMGTDNDVFAQVFKATSVADVTDTAVDRADLWCLTRMWWSWEQRPRSPTSTPVSLLPLTWRRRGRGGRGLAVQCFVLHGTCISVRVILITLSFITGYSRGSPCNTVLQRVGSRLQQQQPRKVESD